MTDGQAEAIRSELVRRWKFSPEKQSQILDVVRDALRQPVAPTPARLPTARFPMRATSVFARHGAGRVGLDLPVTAPPGGVAPVPHVQQPEGNQPAVAASTEPPPPLPIVQTLSEAAALWDGLAASWQLWGDADLMACTRHTQRWTKGFTGANDWFDSRPHLLVLYTIAKWINWPNPNDFSPLRPPRVLEIGVREGPTTMALLCAMRETGGTLTSLEMDKTFADATAEMVVARGLDRWWDLQIENSNDYVVGLSPSVMWDMMFIDGAHDAAQVRLDVENYLPHLRINGVCAFHDYWSTPEPAWPPVQGEYASHVSAVIRELKRDPRYEIMSLPYSYGLTLLRVLPEEERSDR